MKVLVVNSLYPPQSYGGAERSVSLLAEALVDRGHDVSVAALHGGDDTLIETRNGVNVHRLPIRNIYWPFAQDGKAGRIDRLRWHVKDIWNRRAAADVGRVIDAEKPDVVHTNNLTGFSVAVWKESRRRNLPVVHTLRDYSLLCERSTVFRNGRTCQNRCKDCVAFTMKNKQESSKVDAVVSNSRFVLDLHQKSGFFSEVPAHVIFNIAGSGDAPAIERTPEDDLVFGYIGRVEQEKGIEVVLDACATLPPTGWRLKVAGRGDPDYVSRLRERYPSDRVDWLGFCKSDDFYQAIDISVISSVWPEPLPRTLIESIAAGRSTICATSGGIPEIAEASHLAGMYDPYDHQALASLMKRCLAEAPRWRGVQKINREALDQFTADSVLSNYCRVYESCRLV